MHSSLYSNVSMHNDVPHLMHRAPSSRNASRRTSTHSSGPAGPSSGPSAAADVPGIQQQTMNQDDPAQSGTARARIAAPIHKVLFNAPNSVCWLRLGIMLLGVQQASLAHQHHVAFWLFLLSMTLDAVDGWLARKLQQSSAFGAVLDVLLDVLLRGWLWVNALPANVAVLLPLLEMLVFAVTHKVSGSEWKTSFFARAPGWVSAVMAGGRFKSWQGVLAIAGLMGCPLWLWAVRHLPASSVLASPAWGLLLVPGRALAAAVELWVVSNYLKELLHLDAAAAGPGTTNPET